MCTPAGPPLIDVDDFHLDSNIPSGKKSVSFAATEVTNIYMIRKSKKESHPDLFYQWHEYEKFMNDYQREEFRKSVMKWLPVKGVKKFFRRTNSSKGQVEVDL
jgi:hypothetical protein